jgi:hypothetical protein
MISPEYRLIPVFHTGIQSKGVKILAAKAKYFF